MDLQGIQICLQASEQVSGHFMLIAQRASLARRHMAEAQVSAIHLDIDKVIMPRNLVSKFPKERKTDE